MNFYKLGLCGMLMVRPRIVLQGCAKFLKAHGKLRQFPRELRITSQWVAAHVADCSPRVCTVLKSAWAIEAVSPGFADHITLGRLQRMDGCVPGGLSPS